MRGYLVSTGVLPICVGRPFYDYTGIVEGYRRLGLQGIELVFLAEWDKGHPPRTPTSADWSRTPKASVSEIVDLCSANDIAVPAIHVNRDVGTMLCSQNRETILEGQRILEENLWGAERLQAQIAVLHLWDTHAERLDLGRLFQLAWEVARDHKVPLAVENIPISAEGLTQAKAWEELAAIMPEDYGFTLDLNWCSLYDNFAELSWFKHRILNVHVQGRVVQAGKSGWTLAPRVGNLDIIKCLSEFCGSGYDGYITLELNSPRGEDDFRRTLEIITSA